MKSQTFAKSSLMLVDEKHAGMLKTPDVHRLLREIQKVTRALGSSKYEAHVEALDPQDAGQVTFSQCVKYLKRRVDLDMLNVIVGEETES